MIVSQALDPEAEVGRTGVAHAAILRGSLRLAQPGASGGRVVDVPLPKTPFALRKLGGEMRKEWDAFIDELVRNMDGGPFLLIDHDHPLRELVVYANRRTGLRYGLRHDKPMPAVRVIEYALLGNAEAHLFASPELEEDLRKKYVGPYRAVSDMQSLPSALAEKGAHPPLPAADRRGDVTNLLIVSYFSGPCRSVGVQRPNYWFDEIGRLSGGGIRTHIATATPWDEPREDVHFVPDHHAASLCGADGLFPDWGGHVIARDERDSKSFSTLSHYWRHALEHYFDARDDHFDVVVISGNPFSCFDFAAYAKRRWHARVVLDYRDPFANNPRFLYRDDQRQHARYVERGYNFQCDLAATVNDACVAYFEADPDSVMAVVENGFDERNLAAVRAETLDTDRINFVHAGSFYHDRSPRAVIEALDPGLHRFHHVGGTGGIDGDNLTLPQLRLHGRRPYIETLGLLAGGHCGVVFLSQTGFETTTKIYDYLAVGIDVLICTHGIPGHGALAAMLDGESGIYWCRNTPEGVAEFLSTYRPTKRSEGRDTSRYSRQHSTQVLIEHIRKLAGR